MCAHDRSTAAAHHPLACALTGSRPLGGYFAEMARLEAASVVSFRRLAHQLVRHGAPRTLVRAARRAARDEIRHARLAARLARRFGAEYRAPKIAPARRRSLLALALENAREGTVRETFGALAASYQARAATDLEVRHVMNDVATDETRHADLALDVLVQNLQLLDPTLQDLSDPNKGFVERPVLQDVFLATVCALHSVDVNTPVGCP